MKKINLRNLKAEAKNLDMDKIDVGSFWESLFLCGPAAIQFCKGVDKEMNNITSFAYSSCFKPMDQYDRIIENINVKKQLLDLRQTFADWYKALSDFEKKCCKDYVVKRFRKLNGEIGGRPGQHLHAKDIRKTMTDLISSFRDRVKQAYNLKEKELLRNPYIYKLYLRIAYKNERDRIKGEKQHDRSTNERCYC